MNQDVNPGFTRRFAIEDAFMFEDFTEPQLEEILERKLKDQDLGATEKAKQVALGLLSRRKNRPNFGNGGEVENMLTFAKDRYLKRQASQPSHLSLDIVFEPEDFDPNWDRDQHAAANLAQLFEDMVGCEAVIQKLGDYQNMAQGMKASGLDMRKQIPTSFIFKGPPGNHIMPEVVHTLMPSLQEPERRPSQGNLVKSIMTWAFSHPQNWWSVPHRISLASTLAKQVPRRRIFLRRPSAKSSL
jgi:hypothetical protein